MERNNRDLKRCDICNLEISKTNWSKHIKSKKHLDNIQSQRNNENLNELSLHEFESNIQKHCGIYIIIFKSQFVCLFV